MLPGGIGTTIVVIYTSIELSLLIALFKCKLVAPIHHTQWAKNGEILEYMYICKLTVSSGTVQPDFKNKYDLDIYDLR